MLPIKFRFSRTKCYELQFQLQISQVFTSVTEELISRIPRINEGSGGRNGRIASP